MNATIPAFVPKYIAEFSCVGASCVDTCCSGWTVALDKETYKKYKAVDLQRPALKLRPNIEPFPPDRRSDAQFGRVRMAADGSCPFLNPDRLCGIQATLGAGMLSHTCARYPRMTRNFDGMGQQSLTPSCPEAARLMLSNRDAMDIEVRALPTAMSPRAEPLGNSAFDAQVAAQVRFRFMEFMRSRPDLPIWQRLTTVGLACAALDEISDVASQQQFVLAMDGEQLFADLAQIAGASVSNLPGQATIFGKLFIMRQWGQIPMSAFQRATLDDIITMFSNVDADSNAAHEVVALQYAQGLQGLNQFLDERSFLMENYVAHLMFVSAFPFNEKSWRAAFFKMLAKYGIVRFMLAIKAAAKKDEFSERDFRDCIVVFTRFYEHNLRFKKTVDQLLDKFEALSISAVGSLLRDDRSPPKFG